MAAMLAMTVTFSNFRSMAPLKRARGRARTAIEARIRDAIDDLRPLLRIEPVGIELLEFRAATGTALLRIDGDCPDCNMSAATMIHGIAAHLRMRVPEVREVHVIDGSLMTNG